MAETIDWQDGDYVYCFDPKQKLWVGAIICDDVVATVGVEITEELIKIWCEKTLASGVDAPDYFDRKN